VLTGGALNLLSEDNFITTDGILDTQTSATLMAIMATYSRPSFNVTVDVVSSKFHRGEVFFSVIYGINKAELDAMTFEEVSTMYGAYVSIVDGQLTKTFHIPYRDNTPYIRYPRVSSNTPEDFHTSGMWSLWIVNPLSHNAGVATEVDVNVDIAIGDKTSYYYSNSNAAGGAIWPDIPYDYVDTPVLAIQEDGSTDGEDYEHVPEKNNSTAREKTVVRGKLQMAMDCCNPGDETDLKKMDDGEIHQMARGTGTWFPEQFGAAITTSFRDFNRRFVQVIEGSLDDITTLFPQGNVYGVMGLMANHPSLAICMKLFRYMRGSIRVKVVVTTTLVPIVITLSPEALSSASTTFTQQFGFGTKYLGVAAPVGVFEVPFLSPALSYITPYSVPDGGTSLNAHFNLSTLGSGVAIGSAITYVLSIAAGDDFRFAGFMGMPVINMSPFIPNTFASNPDRFSITNTVSVTGSKKVKRNVVRGKLQVGIQAAGDEQTEKPKENIETLGVEDIAEVPIKTAAVHGSDQSFISRALNEPSWTLGDTQSRLSRVTGVEWVIGDAVGTQIAKFDIPLGILTNELLRVAFENFRYWRGEVELVFKVTASPQHHGRLMVVFVPGLDDAGYALRYGTATNWMKTVDHLELDAATSTEGVFKIPFISQYLALRQKNNFDDQDLDHWIGAVRLVVYNTLKAEDTGATSARVNVMTRFVNTDIMIPTHRVTLS
jgi:hypothetical protein